MAKQILAIGSVFAVLIVTTLVVLSVLDVITLNQLRITVGKAAAAIGVMTAGALVTGMIVQLAKSA
jgi:hypothetical protein